MPTIAKTFLIGIPELVIIIKSENTSSPGVTQWNYFVVDEDHTL
jgi:hypothetical protein